MNKIYKSIRDIGLATLAVTSMIGMTRAQCTVEVAPWSYDVESAAPTTNSSIAECWSSTPNNTTSSYRWNVGSSTPSLNTGPSSAYSGSQFFYTEASSSGGPAYLETPEIDLSGLTVPQFEFYYHMYGSDINTLNVQVSEDNGASWTTELTILGEQQTSATDPWKDDFVLLDTYTGVVSIRFEAIRGNSFEGDISLDDIAVVEAPTCIKPTNLTATNITQNSVELDWQENNGATAWTIEYGAPGFALGSGTQDPVTSKPHTLTISPLSSYEYYVQTDCGGGDLSDWKGPYFFSNDYCQFTISNSSPQNIESFSTTGAVSDISNLNSGSGTTFTGYSDFTSIQLDAYETQLIDFTVSASSTSTYGFSIFVDLDNSYTFEPGEKIYASSGYESMPQSGSFSIPAGIAQGQYRMRIVADYLGSTPGACSGNSAEAEDYTLNIVQPPSCLPPVDIDSVSVSTTTVELQWNELNTNATNWFIEYGLSGFTPGTGTEVNATTNPFTVTGLAPSTQHDFYIRTDCGSNDTSDWRGPYSVYTDCGVAVAPWAESFNNGTQPLCWENENNINSTSSSNLWKFSGNPGYGATNNGRPAGTFAWADGSASSLDSMMLITPEIDLSALTTPYLAFEWFSNNDNDPGNHNPVIVEVSDGSSWTLLDTLQGVDSLDWMFVNYDLSAFMNDTIQIRFMYNTSVITTTAFYHDVLIDEIVVDDCISLGGQDGSLDVCRLDNTVNLEDNIIVKPNGGGLWSFPDEENYIVDDTVFNVALLPAGSYEVYYVERAVCYDTTVATINVYGPSSAGTGGTVDVCKNEPINLYGVLSGNVDMGGQWFDFTNTALPNSQPKAQAIPGQYNYTYIVTNGVCPADTAVVEVGVLDTCDFLSVGEEQFTDISVYPNPSTDVINVVNPSNTSSLKLEMLDMNGRVVLVETKALNNATEATVSIEHLEKGIYTLRVYNDEGQKTFKVVKQ